ncbi:probable chitinase 2 [Sitodiplosis mosellana]|uniref:probable chitinase 2 n=1 Tax=Sitodiplosis mosellana TaxID=263140 RepID=UPI0024450B1C|nr:probable chitinase 2 [Sitodiplosis mosellana]
MASLDGPTHGKAVICTDLAEPSFVPSLFYRLTGLSQFDTVNLNLCTHLIYMDVSFTRITDFSNPWPYVTSDYSHVQILRKRYPHLKISLGILNDANDLANIASDQISLQKFIKSALDFVLNNNLDGLNLYWNYLDWNIYDKSSAKANILTLVMELSNRFKHRQLLLTSAFAEHTTETFEEIYDYVEMSKYLDFMHFNKLQKVDAIIKLGVPPSKIIIEFNTKTLSDRVAQFMLTDLYSFMNSFKVFLKYNEICDLLSTNEVISKVYDANTEQMVAHYVDGKSNKMHSISYESTYTLANKTRRAMRHNLGGVSVNNIDADDSKGRCKIETDTFDDFVTNSNVTLNIPIRRDPTFPLLRTINEAIVLALDEMGQPPKPIDNKISSRKQSNNVPTWDTLLANFIDSF